MAGNARNIHGDVILDVKVSGEQDARARMQEAFAGLEANIGVNPTFPNKATIQKEFDTVVGDGLKLKISTLVLPTRAKMQAQLDTEAQKGGGLKLFIDELHLPGKKEMQAQLDHVSGRDSANGLTLSIAKIVLPLKKEMQLQLDARVGDGLNLRVRINPDNTSLLPVVAATKAAQEAVTQVEAIEIAKRDTFRERERSKQESQDNAARRRKELNEDLFDRRALERDAAVAQRREIIADQLNARLLAQDNQFRQRQQFAAERSQRQLQSKFDKPILQQVLIDTNKLNSSLGDFDRVVSRALKASLLSFTAWSAGVEIATAAAGAAGVAAFAKLQLAATRAAAVVASDTFSKEMLTNGHAVSNFADVSDAASKRIIAASQQVALATIGFNPTDVTEGVQSLLQAGEKLPEALKNIGPAAKFAQVNQADLKETTDGLAASLASAGLGSQDAALLLDKFSFTAQSALGNSGDFLEAFANRAGSSFKAYGRGVNETLTLLQLLGNTGVTGREAGTQAFIVLRDIAKAAGKSPEAFKKYNIAIRDAENRNTKFSTTLVDLSREFQKVQKAGGDVGVFKFAQELGLTQKSIGSLLQIIPQVSKQGQQGLDDFNKQLDQSGGNIERQVKQQRKTIAAQFDNLKDTFSVVASTFGQGAEKQVTRFFDIFAGTGGKISQATDQINAFGVAFGEIVGRLANFVQTDAFTNGVKTLVEAIKITLGGVSDAVAAFGESFHEADKGVSTFEAFANAIKAFSQLSATVLPIVAGAIGKTINFLIDHRDAFETFAKITLAVFALRKAFTLLLNPIGQAVLVLQEFIAAQLAAQAAGSGGLFITFLGSVATRMSVVTASTEAATAATLELAAAQLAASRGGTAAAGAGVLGSLGSRPAAKGIFGSNRVGEALKTQRIQGAATLGEGAAVSNAALNTKIAAAFGRITASLQESLPLAERLSKIAGEIGIKFAKVGGPIAIITAVIEVAIGAVKGFVEEFNRGGNSANELKASLIELKPVFDALIVAAKVLLDVVGLVGRVAASAGRVLGGALKDALTSLADLKRAFTADSFGGAAKAIADVLLNAFTAPFRAVVAFAIDFIADSIKHLERLPFVGDKAKKISEGLRDAANSARDFKLNLSEAQVATQGADSATKSLADSTRQAAVGVSTVTAALTAQQQAALAAVSATLAAQPTGEFLATTTAITGAQQALSSLSAQFSSAGQSQETFLQGSARLNAQTVTIGQALNSFGAAAASTQGPINQLAAGVQSAVSETSVLTSALGQFDGVMQVVQGTAANTANVVTASFGGVPGAVSQANDAISILIQNIDAAGVSANFTGQEIQTAIGLQGQFVGLLGIGGDAGFKQALQDQKDADALAIAIKKRQRVNKILQDSGVIKGVGTPAATPAAGSSPAAAPAQRQFVDPDQKITAQLDRLKPLQKVAQVQSLVNKLFGETAKSDANLGRSKGDLDKALNKAAGSYQLTRRETLLLADAQPRLEKALEKQRAAVTALDDALNNLKITQIQGSQAFSDQQFGIDQQIKQLQLNRITALEGGNTDGSQVVIEIDKQITKLQQDAEKLNLQESLQLDPLRRDLEKAFNPVKELPFDQIIAQFTQISAQRDAANAKLVQQEAVQAQLNLRLQEAQTHYDKIDEAAQRSVDAFNKSQQSVARASTSFTAVSSSASAGARSVNSYSKAVESVPTGKGVVDKSLKGINDRVTELVPQFRLAGGRIIIALTQGINIKAQQSLVPALRALATTIGVQLNVAGNEGGLAYQAGRNIMFGFQQGMIDRSGIPVNGGLGDLKKGTLAHYLHVVIPDWIRANKGPVSYDATILVPAGQAVMEGFGTGLRSGFEQIKGFVKDVGPGLKEFINPIDFNARVAPLFADVMIGKTPDFSHAFDDLRADVQFGGTGGGFAGAIDPTLGFLHKVLSQEDTKLQALQIVKSLGNGLNFNPKGEQFVRPAGTLTSSGHISDHTLGTAADIGAGGGRPTETSLHLFDVAKKLLGSVFRQVIHNGRGFTAGGGSFPDQQHYDHVHLGFLKAAGWDRYSGKIGAPPALDFPGSSEQVDLALAQASRKNMVDNILLGSIAFQESSFNPKAHSGDGGEGLMQLTTQSYKDRANRIGGVYNPFASAEIGAEVLNEKIRGAGGNLWKGVERYNGSGPAAQHYADVIRGHYERFKKLFGGFREAGGPVSSGKAYVVGEKRPEIFVPNRSGTILPDAAATLSGRGGGGYTDNRKFDVRVETAATDPNAVADVFEARMRSRLTGVNIRR